MSYILFFLGAAVGSFLNVVALRYDPDKFIFGRHLLGRSRCPRCQAQLRWFELIPILIFIFQRGRCLSCGVPISWQYPVVEILSGLIFVLIPAAFISPISPMDLISPIIWILIFEVLLLVAVIDLRLKIIPDELNVFLFALGAAAAYFFSLAEPSPAERSFLGAYGLTFGFWQNIWINRALAALAGAAVFGFLILVTRGRGVGFGDLKLAIPLGVVFGWPDVLILTAIAFVIGALAGGSLMAYSALVRAGRAPARVGLKSALPFAPFLVLASAVVFFRGEELARWYFGLFPG